MKHATNHLIIAMALFCAVKLAGFCTEIYIHPETGEGHEKGFFGKN